MAVRMLMQYIALGFGVVGLAYALLRLIRRPKPRKTSASPMTAQALRQLRTGEFIRLVGYAFQARGYHVVESGLTGPRADGAVDIELRKDREAYLVHCRHWKSRKIDVDAVRAFHALMTERRAAGGFVVTTGRFSRDAMLYVRGLSLSLIDGGLLVPMLDEGRNRKPAAATLSATLPLVGPQPVEWSPESVLVPLPDVLEDTFDLARQPAVDTRQTTAPASPRCPLCSAPMSLRTAPPGRHAGRGFWRCSRRRECKGMRPLV
jgi:restriction system protein